MTYTLEHIEHGMCFAEALRAFCVEAEVTQRDIAEYLGVTEGAVSRWVSRTEGARRLPSQEGRRALVKLFREMGLREVEG